MVNREFKAGEPVFSKGDAGDTFYVVEEGTFRWVGGCMAGQKA
jgi:CRP-like cAMP-binding protein